MLLLCVINPCLCVTTSLNQIVLCSMPRVLKCEIFSSGLFSLFSAAHISSKLWVKRCFTKELKYSKIIRENLHEIFCNLAKIPCHVWSYTLIFTSWGYVLVSPTHTNTVVWKICFKGMSIKTPRRPQVFFLNLYYMKYIKRDLPDHLKLYIKIILLQYAHTGNIMQKGAGFEWFRESLKHLGCCAILWQILLLPLQTGKVFSMVEVQHVCHSSIAWLQYHQL